MERHVTILAILCSLWGALAMLVGVSLLLLSVGAIAILFSPDGRAVTFAAGLTATAFAVMGAVALAWGAAHVGASVLLRRRQAAGRVLTFGLAVVNLLVLPFGTELSISAVGISIRTNENALAPDVSLRVLIAIDARKCSTGALIVM